MRAPSFSSTIAVTGRSGPLKMILRLSKLRRLIQVFEKRTEAMAEQTVTLHETFGVFGPTWTVSP